MHLLTLLSTSNPGLLKEAIEKQASPQIKSISIKILSNISRNSQITDEVYQFLFKLIDEKVKYKFLKSIKHFPLERKLTEIQKIIKYKSDKQV